MRLKNRSQPSLPIKMMEVFKNSKNKFRAPICIPNSSSLELNLNMYSSDRCSGLYLNLNSRPKYSTAN